MTEFKLPTTEEIELMNGPTLVKTFNYLAPTAGQNPVKGRFATRDAGIKRLVAIVDTLRAKHGAVVQITPTDWPLVASPNAAPKIEKRTAPKMTSEENTAATIREAKPAAPKSVPQKSVVAAKKPNLSERLRELINDKRKLDNAAIWEIVQPEFGLADDKKGYVAGQRRAMAKK